MAKEPAHDDQVSRYIIASCEMLMVNDDVASFQLNEHITFVPFVANML